MWQVDMDGMSHIFSSFISFLQLDDAYNIIILNPKRNATRANYGYRYEYAHIFKLKLFLSICFGLHNNFLIVYGIFWFGCILVNRDMCDHV